MNDEYEIVVRKSRNAQWTAKEIEVKDEFDTAMAQVIAKYGELENIKEKVKEIRDVRRQED